MRVIQLLPGMQILEPHKNIAHTFVAQTAHPLYKNLQLVIWRLHDGTWSHDALSPNQDVGLAMPFAGNDLEDNLRKAFHG